MTSVEVYDGQRSKTAVTLQMRSGELQSPHSPVTAHGVFLPSRRQLGPQAHRFARTMASSTPPATSLFRPTT